MPAPAWTSAHRCRRRRCSAWTAPGRSPVAFSTGDQDNLAPDPISPPPAVSQHNYVASVTESVKVASDGTRTFQSKPNWRYAWPQTGSPGGERVIGPMTLFNKTLYFSSFLQAEPSAASCKIGDSTIWAVDYVKPLDVAAPYNGGDYTTAPGCQGHHLRSGLSRAGRGASTAPLLQQRRRGQQQRRRISSATGT